MYCVSYYVFFVFKQKTAYEMRISDWSSDVCSSDLIELSGLIIPFRVIIRSEDLLKMEQVEHEMVLQCSGNGRAQYPGIPGTPWGQGGVANVRDRKSVV